MVYGRTIFYQAIKDTEFRIFLGEYEKYITKITDDEHTEHKEWDYLIDAESYLTKKMKEVENKE